MDRIITFCFNLFFRHFDVHAYIYPLSILFVYIHAKCIIEYVECVVLLLHWCIVSDEVIMLIVKIALYKIINPTPDALF